MTTEQTSPPPLWKLILYDGRDARGIFPIVTDGLTIGRALDNHIPLDDEYVSRYHARLNVQPGQLMIEDLDSANGIIVNGRLIPQQMVLRPGDMIELGPFHFQVETGNAPIKPLATLQRRRRFPLIAGLLLLTLLTSFLIGGLVLHNQLRPEPIPPAASIAESTTLPTPTMTHSPTSSAEPTETATPRVETATPEPLPPTDTPTVVPATPTETHTRPASNQQADQLPRSPTATRTPTPQPTDTPTRQPSVRPTNSPTLRPTRLASPQPTRQTVSTPTILIAQAPDDQSQIALNEPLFVQVIANDPAGVVRLELWANQRKVDQFVSPLPSGATSTSALLRWSPRRAGSYRLELRATNQAGQRSMEPVATVTVIAPVSPTGTPRPQPTPLLRPTATPSALATAYLTVDVARLTVRAGPGIEYLPLAELARNTQLEIIGQTQVEQGQWWQVRFENGIGWLPNANSLIRVDNAANVPLVETSSNTTPRPRVAATMRAAGQTVIRPPEGQTLLIASNRSLDNHPARLTLSLGKSVGGGRELDVKANGEMRLTLEPDFYRGMWSSPVGNLIRWAEFDAVADQIVVLWLIPEKNIMEMEIYDEIVVNNQPMVAPTAAPAATPTFGYAAPENKALFVASNRSLENAHTIMTISGGNFGGGKQIVLDSGVEIPLELLAGDYRVIWTAPIRSDFSVGRNFSVVAGEVILSWAIPEERQVFMQFPGQPAIAVNN